MKVLFTSIVLILMTIFVDAQTESLSYIITPSDTMYCKKILVGNWSIKGELYSGQKIKIPIRNVNLYATNGKVMKKLPVYVHNKKTSINDFMEWVECTKGVRIYKYEKFNGCKDCFDVIFSFYINGECIHTETNPSVAQIYDYVKGLTASKTELLTSEQKNE